MVQVGLFSMNMGAGQVGSGQKNIGRANVQANSINNKFQEVPFTNVSQAKPRLHNASLWTKVDQVQEFNTWDTHI